MYSYEHKRRNIVQYDEPHGGTGRAICSRVGHTKRTADFSKPREYLDFQRKNDIVGRRIRHHLEQWFSTGVPR